MEQLKHIWVLAVKDLKLFVADRGALFFFLLFPLVFIIMISLMNVGSEDPRLELHLVTQEAEGGLSYQIIGTIETKDESKLSPGEPKIIWDKDYQEAYRAVEDKKLSGFLLFPEDFTQGVLMGYGVQLEVVADAEAVNTSTALSGLAQIVASRVGSQQVVNRATIGLLVEEGLATAAKVPDIEQIIGQLFSDQEGVAPRESFIRIDTEKVGEIKAKSSSNWVIPGYLVMFVFFGAALAAETVVRERQNHTLERLLASSVRRGSILGGIFSGIAAKGLMQILLFWTVGVLAFGTDLGPSPAAVILLSVLMVVMSSAFGIMLATLVKTQRSAGSIAVLASLVLAPLGGCWLPLFVFPRWLQLIAKITPHAWAIAGFNKLMLFGADFTAVVPEMLVLASFAVAFGIIAIYRFSTSSI